jgi:hypothetical protein
VTTAPGVRPYANPVDASSRLPRSAIPRSHQRPSAGQEAHHRCAESTPESSWPRISHLDADRFRVQATSESDSESAATTVASETDDLRQSLERYLDMIQNRIEKGLDSIGTAVEGADG